MRRILMLCVVLLLALGSLDAASAVVREFGPVFNAQTGHWYSIYKTVDETDISWTTAKALAEGQGGYLATLLTEQEDRFVLDAFAGSVIGIGVRAWIGLTDSNQEGVFEWVTGPEGIQPLTYNHWLPGEPSDSGEDFVEWRNEPNGYGTNQAWNDVPNNAAGMFRFMVERNASDLSVAKTSPATVFSGTNLTYGITLMNNGPENATNVTFSDPVPAGAAFVALTSPTGFACTTPAVGSGGTVSCTTPSLASGASSNLQLVISIPEGLEGSIISNTVTVTATTPDPNPSNNTSTTTTTVIAVPTITSLNPSSRTATSPAFTLTVNGTNYLNDINVQWNGMNLATTFISATQLTATVPASLTAASGTANVTVLTPDGAISPPAIFTIIPAPFITSLSPESRVAGGPAFTLAVNGANFASGMTVQWNGSPLATTFVNTSQLTASVPAELVATPGSAIITVVSVDGVVTSQTTLTIASAPAVTPVPTITERGMILFMLLAGLGAVYHLRINRRI